MENKKEQLIAVIFSIVGSLAILINLALKGFTPENGLDAVKDLVGLLITVAVFFVAYSMSNRSLSYLEHGRRVLSKIQKKNPDFLMGPRYNREDYDPEKGKGLEYLFITNKDPKSKLRAKFIIVNPLEEGILSIHIQKSTLVYGLNYPSEQATSEEIKKIQKEVNDHVKNLLDSKFSDVCEIIKTTKEDSAIIIDFDESKMGKRKFSKAIEECVNESIIKIKSFMK